MVKGLSRQSVYPMEVTKNDLVAPTSDDSADSTANDSSSPDREQQREDRDKVDAFYNAPTSETRSLSPLHTSEEWVAGDTGKPTQTQTPPDRTDTIGSTGGVVPEVASGPDDGDPPRKSSDAVEGLSTAPSYPSPQTKAASGGGGGGRRLVFADETGGALAEVSYSNRTHYSKQTGPSALGGAGRACCTIS